MPLRFLWHPIAYQTFFGIHQAHLRIQPFNSELKYDPKHTFVSWVLDWIRFSLIFVDCLFNRKYCHSALIRCLIFNPIGICNNATIYMIEEGLRKGLVVQCFEYLRANQSDVISYIQSSPWRAHMSGSRWWHKYLSPFHPGGRPG